MPARLFLISNLGGKNHCSIEGAPLRPILNWNPKGKLAKDTTSDHSLLKNFNTLLEERYWWISAPRHLLTSIANLRSIRHTHPTVSAVALQKKELHFNFFSPENVVFAMFDEQLGDDTREAMAKKLLSYRAQRLIHELQVHGPYFCTGLIGQAAHLISQYSADQLDGGASKGSHKG